MTATTLSASPLSPSAAPFDTTPVRTVTSRRDWRWPVGVAGVGALTALLTLIGLADGARSEYYAAIAKSMSLSWSNFFFGSLDPAGTVTLDKIPGSYWMPALSAKVFGFSTWSIELPNALAAVGAALFMAFAVKRLAGTWAGIFAGLIVGTTPILIAVSRSNQPESFFVLALAFAFWAAVHAVTKAKLSWLIIAGVGVGLAFQCYMLEAWAFWPGLAAAYLCNRQTWWRKVWHLAVAGAMSLATSLAWIAIVAAIPASDRPFIGSTINNSPWEMVFGYNGLGRFGATSGSTDYNSFTPPFSGSAGVFRLFNDQVAGQIAWLLPAALLAIVILAVLRVRLAVTILIGGTLLTYVAMFSMVAGMHQFYVAALAVPISAAVAVAFGVARTRKAYWAQYSLLGVTALTALILSFVYSDYLPWVAWIQIAIAIAAAMLVLAESLRMPIASWITGSTIVAAMILTPFAWSVGTIGNSNSLNPIAGSSATSGMGGMGGMGGGPGGMGGPGNQGSFSGQSGPGGQGSFGGQNGPGGQSGQSMQGGPGGFAPNSNSQAGGSTTNNTAAGMQVGTPQGGANGGGMGSGSQVDSTVLNYLTANRNGAKYLVAMFGAQSAASWITQTGENVLPIGGFSGNDNVPTLTAFQNLVSTGQLNYVLMSDSGIGGGTGGPGGGMGSTSTTTSASQIKTWVQANCTAVTANGISTGALYQCTGSVS